MIFTDHFFRQGVTHSVCQDYALSGDGYAIVSDGCSTGLDTDVGARILAKAGQGKIKFLQGVPSPEESFKLFQYWLGQHIYEAKKAIGLLPESSLAATLLAAYKTETETDMRAIMFGDGVFGGKKRDGTWEICNYEFDKGPFYPYYIFADKSKEFKDNYGAGYQQTQYVGDLNGVMTKTVSRFELDFSAPYFWRLFPLKDFEFVFVGSDGLASFYKPIRTATNKHNEPVSLLDVLRVMLDVNYNRSGFFQLQGGWAFKRQVEGTFVHKDWHNSDDVSIAGISCK